MNHSAEQLEKAIEKISRRGATRDLPDKSFTLDLYRDKTSMIHRRKVRGKRGQHTISDKISMVFAVLCEGEYQADVARQF